MKASPLTIRVLVLCALAQASFLALTGCSGDVVVSSSSGEAAAPGSGGAASETSGSGGAVPGTASAGGAPGTGAMSVACGDPATGVIPYADPIDLYSLLIGQWLRCEGTIQPVGGAPAPDGQDGLEFDAPGPQPGAVYGLQSWSLPLPAGGTGVLTWVGGLYEPVGWTYTVTPAGPGVSFTGTTIAPVTDTPVFTNGGKRMSLSDPMWQGTYVRYQP